MYILSSFLPFTSIIPTHPPTLPLTSPLTVGKTLAYTSIRFTNAKDELVARGSHTKYIAMAWQNPENITDELSPRPEK